MRIGPTIVGVERPAGMSETQHAAIAEMALGRRGRVRAYLFEVASALGFALLGAVYLAEPGLVAIHSVIGRRVYPFDYVWSVGYIAGGLLMVAGLLLPQLRLRVAGLILLGTALTLQVAAAFVEAPQARDVFNALYAAACFMRAVLLTKLFRIYHGAGTEPRDAGGR